MLLDCWVGVSQCGCECVDLLKQLLCVILLCQLELLHLFLLVDDLRKVFMVTGVRAFNLLVDVAQMCIGGCQLFLGEM